MLERADFPTRPEALARWSVVVFLEDAQAPVRPELGPTLAYCRAAHLPAIVAAVRDTEAVANGFSVSRSQLPRYLGDHAVILFLQLALFPKGLFPAPLQLAGHQAVFRLDGMVLPRRSFGLDSRPFHPRCQ